MDTKNTPKNSQDQHKQAEQDMLYRLKSAIDGRGRYAYRLNDMASGYAAANGMPATVARMEIERKFTDQFGKSPQEYLDRHYEEMRENGLIKPRERTNGLDKTKSQEKANGASLMHLAWGEDVRN